MIHKLTDIDSGKCLPEKKELINAVDGGPHISNPVDRGYNQRCSEEDQLALEPQIEVIAKLIEELKGKFGRNEVIDNPLFLAGRIADNKECFKIVRVK